MVSTIGLYMDSCPNSAHAQEAQFIETVSVFGPRPKWLRCVLRGLYLGSRSPWNTWVLFGFYVASIWALFGFLFGVFGFIWFLHSMALYTWVL